MECLFDDAEGTRLNTRDDGGLEIERYVESPPTTTLTRQEAMDIAVSVIEQNAPKIDDLRFCETCRYHWPDDQCKRLFLRPERTIPDVVLKPANCLLVNQHNNCGYHEPRETNDGFDES